ncbi:MAG: hypothetical protein GC159_22760 [Phycisphaera sp.]|nr:hypothetical protein [Phycisphaera sp.]
MLQISCLIIALLAVMTGVKTLRSGSIQLDKNTRVEGGKARALAIGLMVFAAVVVWFALILMPSLIK